MAEEDKKQDMGGGLDDAGDDEGTLKLVSSDGKSFTVEKKHAKISALVRTSTEQDADAEEIPIPGVKSDTLAKVVEYMVKHEGTEAEIVEKPLRSKVMAEVCKFPWDAEFIDGISGRQELYDLILAANYMDIKGLLHLGCAKVASLIKGQPLEKIKEILDPNAKHDDSKSS